MIGYMGAKGYFSNRETKRHPTQLNEELSLVEYGRVFGGWDRLRIIDVGESGGTSNAM
jgi:hypothetical protein